MKPEPYVDNKVLEEKIEHFDLFCFVAKSYIINISPKYEHEEPAAGYFNRGVVLFIWCFRKQSTKNKLYLCVICFRLCLIPVINQWYSRMWPGGFFSFNRYKDGPVIKHVRWKADTIILIQPVE